ncbi:MAG: HD domain-containing protein [Candidatus Berkelbacteria bacterium]|nr:HD domain-containing protein [Candidatus Berkelbacteria bacterium]
MKLDRALEEKIKQKAEEVLIKCRPNWDLPHTQAAVYWMKQLIEHEGGDERILIPAIYLHDIGYYDLIGPGYTYQQLRQIKPKHMIKGEKLARQILNDLPLSEKEVKEITHLVRIHDDIPKIESFNEQMVFEADCLGMIDREKAGVGSLAKESVGDFLQSFKKRRMPKLKSKLARGKVKEFFEKEKNEIDKSTPIMV